MNSRRRDSRADDMRRATTSRRALLAAGGAVAIGALSGCLGQASSSVTNTESSPAAVFAGADWNDDDTEVTFNFEDELLSSPHVARLTPRVSAGSGLLSSEVELEGWITSTALAPANYNNSRSNKSTIRAPAGDGDSDADGVDDDVRGEDYNSPRSNRSIAGPSDLFDDEIDEDDETFRRVSRLDAQLQEATTATVTAISKRSARTGRNPETEKEITETLGDMEAVLAEMRAVLERCSDESCVAPLENVKERETDVRRAQEYAQDGEWEAFGLDGGGDGNDILVGDYLLPPVEFDSSGSFTPAERAELFRYLEQNPVVTERFSVCLPDAEVSGGSESIREAVTPELLIDYIAGNVDPPEGGVYTWGSASAGRSGPDETGDCDDDDPSSLPSPVCGTTPHFVAEVSEPTATGGSLEVVRTDDGTVVVSNSPPEADGGPAAVRVSAEGGSDGPASSTEAIDQAWSSGASNGGGNKGSSPIIVKLVRVQPPNCPVPIPALFYVGRAESGGQLLYSGGWVLDDAALYENSVTALTLAGSARVVGIECCFDYDSDGDGLRDVLARAELSERERRGARPAAGPVEELVNSSVLSEPVGGEILTRMQSGREQDGESRGPVTGDEYGFVTNVPVDTPVLHLVNAASASDEVKFKAGAELSKSVN